MKTPFRDLCTMYLSAEREVRAALRELEQAQQDHQVGDKAKTDALLAAQLRVEEAQAKLKRATE
jgi:Arc/MetJ-type ribon-helix-helix transcriptional regulator